VRAASTALTIPVLLAIVLLGTHAAVAQPATELFEEGRRLLAAGKPVEACAKFDEAVRLDPEAPGVLLNLGLCNAEQNRVATALKWFRKAETLAAERGMTAVEDAAKQRTTTLAARVPTLKVELVAPPAGANVMLDGATVDPATLGRIEVDAGSHVVALEGPGLEPDRQTIDVRDDARLQLVTLHAVPARLVIAAVDPAAVTRRRAYVFGAIGGGLLVGETVLSLVGKDSFDNSHSVDTRDDWKDIVRYGSTSRRVTRSRRATRS
jgi:hypothetical protein